jgi:hypothetical protein
VIDLINEVALEASEIYPAIECLREIVRMAKAKLTG